MKRVRIVFRLALLLVSGGTSVMNAQSPQYSIFDALEQQSKSGDGVVIIQQSNAIKSLVGTRTDSDNLDMINGKTFFKTRGYRIQVYSGNIQPTSKDEAESLQKQIRSLYPNHEADRTFDAPFWKLHVGNFLTFEEASIMLRELQKTFPQRKKEIYIIEDIIRLPLE